MVWWRRNVCSSGSRSHVAVTLCPGVRDRMVRPNGPAFGARATVVAEQRRGTIERGYHEIEIAVAVEIQVSAAAAHDRLVDGRPERRGDVFKRAVAAVKEGRMAVVDVWTEGRAVA